MWFAFIVGFTFLSISWPCASATYDDNYCLEFDGKDDFIIFDFEEELDNGLSSSEWTLECWVQVNSQYKQSGPQQVNFLGYPKRAPNLEMSVNNGEQKVLTQLRESNGHYYTLKAAEEIRDKDWHHVAGSWDNNTLLVFIDGEVAASSNPYDQGYREPRLCQEDCNLGLFIGGFRFWNNSQQYFHGLIDEVRVWNYGRDQDEIKETMNRVINPETPGLLYYWRFDEGKGSFVLSLTEEQSPGTLGGLNPEHRPLWKKSTAPLSESSSEVMHSPSDNTVEERVSYTSPLLWGMLIGSLILIVGFAAGVMVGGRFKGKLLPGGWQRSSVPADPTELPSLMDHEDEPF